jgi:hypothetical protein
MASPKKKSAPGNGAGKQAQREIPGEISEMGKILRRLAEKNVASGVKLLNRRELEREIAERRGTPVVDGWVHSYFLDSGVLITAFSGERHLMERALAVLGDPRRVFLASPFIRHEIRGLSGLFWNARAGKRRGLVSGRWTRFIWPRRID